MSGRTGALAATALFVAAVLAVPFHLAHEKHDARPEHPDETEDGSSHAPHPSADHQLEAFAPVPQLDPPAVPLDLPLESFDQASPAFESAVVLHADHGPPERPGLTLHPSRAPPTL